MDDDKTGKRRVGTPVPGCPKIPSRRDAHPHFLHKKALQNAKTGSTSSLISQKGCASLLYFCEKLGLNFLRFKVRVLPAYFSASSTATATDTVIPTMGEQCEALRFKIPATCRWQVATLPMGAEIFPNRLLQRFLDCNSHGHSHTDHG